MFFGIGHHEIDQKLYLAYFKALTPRPFFITRIRNSWNRKNLSRDKNPNLRFLSRELFFKFHFYNRRKKILSYKILMVRCIDFKMELWGFHWKIPIFYQSLRINVCNPKINKKFCKYEFLPMFFILRGLKKKNCGFEEWNLGMSKTIRGMLYLEV